jgi:hypothetical protein
MEIKKIIERQYLAPLAMLNEAVEKCPPETWNAPQDTNKSWQVVYHKLELHLYNIRHIQHHVGELYERLGARNGTILDWVGAKS